MGPLMNCQKKQSVFVGNAKRKWPEIEEKQDHTKDHINVICLAICLSREMCFCAPVYNLCVSVTRSKPHWALFAAISVKGRMKTTCGPRKC